MNGHSVTPEQLISRHSPLDDIEPQELHSDLVRDARIQTVRLLNAFGNVIERTLTDPNVNLTRVRTAFWGASYALGLNCCAGVSMTQRAASLNIERATISKAARNFVTANSLPPSYYMKLEAASDSYREARIQIVIASNNGNGSNGNGSNGATHEQAD